MAAERETAAAILAFVIVLVRATNLKTKIYGVPSMRQEPVIVEAYA